MIIPAKLSKIIKRHLKYTPEGYKNVEKTHQPAT